MGSTFEAVRMQRYHDSLGGGGGDGGGRGSGRHRWVVGSVTATFLLALTMIALQLAPRTAHLLAGTKLELLLILLAAGFTCAAVGTATNPATGLAVNASGGVGFANLYFASWAALGCSLALLQSFLRTERGMDVAREAEARGRRFRLWCAAAAASLVAMGSSAACYDARCGGGPGARPPKYCRRAAFGVGAGCAGCVTCLAVVAARLALTKREGNGEGGRSNGAVFVAECVCSAALLCSHCLAAAYLTSEEGPGAPPGNLYYSTWIAFGLIFFVAVSCFEEYRAARGMYLSQLGNDASEAEQGSMILSSYSSRVPNVENYTPAEPSREEENAYRQAAALIGNRSGSVGEVQI